jgi:hypothetical protein
MAKKRTVQVPDIVDFSQLTKGWEEADIEQLAKGWEDINIASLLAIIGEIPEPELGDIPAPDR